MNIGFIGLGIMGSGMANNLLKSGFSMYVFNRTREKAKELENNGAKFCSTPKELAEKSDLIFMMLTDVKACRAVSEGKEGFLEILGKGKIVVNFSTVHPNYSLELRNMVKEKGALFLESPVLGSKIPAQKGELVILAAGDKEAFEACTNSFEKISKKTIYLGDVPKASYVKVVNNEAFATSLTAYLEGLAFAKKIGLDPEMVFNILNAGALANPYFEFKIKKVLDDDFETHFSLANMKKDLGYAISVADEFKCYCPTLAAVNEVFKKGLKKHANEDMSAIYKVFDE
ncbi:3-hydroxyisobutyrate dehydrogenase/glyoxylate/succinic semialdehyde reductase [Thermodesulfobium acidiphilum]|uniref:3-hydroxyisobutyrate dehydrogenase/glyoxylate/succinic semialdehyde reductase n=1 Tax=Thermodesulfobium acidiphilum TaxID=1794699 RepID=A0A2R4W0B8_THEAF|nr:3-hydroxyisobutyrate dehydrogenase/glyoxylate/succinic semialdehyde reductase [Thermodesulfobium acidiphilum]